AIAAAHVPATYALIDLATGGAPEQAPSETLRTMLQSMPKDRTGLPAQNPRLLMTLLLGEEVNEHLVAHVGWLDRPFMSSVAAGRGNCREEGPAGDVFHSCFMGLNSPMEVTEERALLRAASFAAQHGGRFLVEHRRDIHHTTVNEMYGTPIAS